MRRPLARARLVAVVAGVALLGGCFGGGGAPQPTRVELVQLVEEQTDRDGQVVTASGTVRTYDEPRHYWIEDADQHRVELVPESQVSPHLGAEVEVTGRFTFREDEGRRIEIDRLEVLSGPDHDPA